MPALKAKNFKVNIKRVWWRGGSKNTVKFSDSLVGPIKLRKAVVFMLMLYYSERILTKSSRGKNLLGHNSEDLRKSFQYSSAIKDLQIAFTSPLHTPNVWNRVTQYIEYYQPANLIHVNLSVQACH